MASRICANRSGSVLIALCLAACSTYDASLLAVTFDPAQPAGGAQASGAGGVLAGQGEPSNAGAAGAMSAGGLAAGDAGSNSDAGATSNAGSTYSAGGVGAAGTAGTASKAGGPNAAGSGAGAGAGGVGAPSFELLDDFEDQDGFVLPLHQRNGPWYVFSDTTKSGMLSPFSIVLLSGADARAGSSAGLHLTANGFTDWGAGVGADLVNLAGKKVAYDVSAYRGIRFYAKVAQGGQSSLKLLIPTTYSDPEGGKCNDAISGKRCSDHLFAQVSGLKTTWDVYQCDFSALSQQGFGLVQTAFEPSSVYSVQFTLSNKLQPIDLWLDDVAFVRK